MSKESGWKFIEKSLAKIYKDLDPYHYGTVQKYNEGGTDPLDGISVYRNLQPLHWHYITYGFTELYEKESDSADISGWGFELTFRLLSETNEDAPPQWPIMFLQKLAHYVFNTGEAFDEGHYISIGGPIVKSQNTLIDSLVFTQDPQLPPINTANGHLIFLQAIGITTQELEFINQNNPELFLGKLKQDNPYMVTDIHRKCMME